MYGIVSMDIRRLEAFCKVYELGSFSKAGQELFLSQPTISSHISSLEEELGVRLFDRMGRSVLTTTAGDILYAHAREIFRSLENARADIEALLDSVSGEIAVGASTIPAQYILPGLLRGFLAAHPHVGVRIENGDSASVIERVADGSLLCGLCGARAEHPDLLFDLVMSDEAVLIAHPSFAAGIGVDATLDQALKWPWIMRETGSGTRKTLELALRSRGADIASLRVVVSAASTEAVINCVRGGLGVSVTSRLAAAGFIERGEVSAVRVPELDMSREFYLVRNARRSLMPAYRHFVEHILTASAPGRGEAT